VNFDLQGRETDDIDAFWDRLDKVGAFHDILWSALTIGEDGLHKVQMKAVYTDRR
jgi:hypothetical protein